MSSKGGEYKYGFPLVFISYSSKDRDIVDQFTEILDKYNIDVWIDHQQIQYGDSILDKISKGLEWSSAIIFLISENSVLSNWCKIEYETALTEEITSKNTRVIPAIIGNPEIPIILRGKKHFEVELTKDRHVVFEEKKYDDLARSIQNETVESNIASLITVQPKKIKLEPEYEGTIIDDHYNCTSLIALLISSVLNDFPVDSLTSRNLKSGKHMKEIFLTILKFIEEFEKLANELISILSAKEMMKHYYTKKRPIDRKLKDIQHNMQSLAESLQSLAGIDVELQKRFEGISNVCIGIADIEGMSLEISVGYENIKDNKRIPDLMAVDKMKKGGGDYLGFEDIEIRELSKALDEIYNYKAALLKEIAESIA